MEFLIKIIKDIDDLIGRIPKDIALTIKRLAGFFLVVFIFIAMYFGYNLGVEASKIPGEPLIKVTNDVLRMKKAEHDAQGRFKLVDPGKINEESLYISPSISVDKLNQKQNSDIKTFQNKSNELLSISSKALSLDLGEKRRAIKFEMLELDPGKINRVEIDRKTRKEMPVVLDSLELGKNKRNDPETVKPLLEPIEIGNSLMDIDQMELPENGNDLKTETTPPLENNSQDSDKNERIKKIDDLTTQNKRLEQAKSPNPLPSQ